jgi:hypothetical protein
MVEQIRAAELTADHLGRSVRIDPGDEFPFVTGRIVRIGHRQVGNPAAPETETRLEVEVLGDQRVTVGFNSIGVVELL